MRIDRHFTTGLVDPFDMFEWRLATSEIKNPDGTVVFRMENIEVPAHWSQVAVDVLAQKYFRKAGVPKLLERVPEQGVPTWLQRCVERAYPAGLQLPDQRDLRQAGVQPPRRLLDLLGLEGWLLHSRWRRQDRHLQGHGRRNQRPRVLRRDALHAGQPDVRAQLPAVVQHRSALGIRHRRSRPGPLLRR